MKATLKLKIKFVSEKISAELLGIAIQESITELQNTPLYDYDNDSIISKYLIQAIRSDRLTTPKSPHVHKKAKKSYKINLYKVSIYIKLSFTPKEVNPNHIDLFKKILKKNVQKCYSITSEQVITVIR